MVRVRISSHAELQALESRSDRTMVVNLRSLESLHIAIDSCAHLRYLIERKSSFLAPVGDVPALSYWTCPQIHLLGLVACVSLELHKIKHDLYPLLVVQEAKLEGGFLKALLLLKNSAAALLCLAEGAKEIVERCVEFKKHDEDDVLYEDEEEEEEDCDVLDFLLGQVGKVEKLGKELKDSADLVLERLKDINWLQLRLPSVLEVVGVLLSTPVRFPDNDLF